MSSINGVGSGISPSALLSLIESAAASSAVTNTNLSSTHGVTPVASTRSADSVHLSGLSLLVAQLQQFQLQHPLVFQQVMVQIAGQLHNASQQTTGNPAVYLSNLAILFRSASQTGNLASI